MSRETEFFRQMRPDMRWPRAEAGRDAAVHDNEELVEVMNLKADPQRIRSLTNRSGIFPAWHMNRTHWISVILDDILTDEQVMELIRENRRLVIRRKRVVRQSAAPGACRSSCTRRFCGNCKED